jgi:hypothetical protein
VREVDIAVFARVHVPVKSAKLCECQLSGRIPMRRHYDLVTNGRLSLEESTRDN